MPDEMGGFDSNPAEVTDHIYQFAKAGLVNIVGGCCGTTPEYIQKISQAVENVPPRQPAADNGLSTYSGFDFLQLRPESTFMNVGERSNVTGSRRFARLIREEKYDAAINVVTNQPDSRASGLRISATVCLP